MELGVSQHVVDFVRGEVDAASASGRSISVRQMLESRRAGHDELITALFKLRAEHLVEAEAHLKCPDCNTVAWVGKPEEVEDHLQERCIECDDSQPFDVDDVRFRFVAVARSKGGALLPPAPARPGSPPTARLTQGNAIEDLATVSPALFSDLAKAGWGGNIFVINAGPAVASETRGSSGSGAVVFWSAVVGAIGVIVAACIGVWGPAWSGDKQQTKAEQAPAVVPTSGSR